MGYDAMANDASSSASAAAVARDAKKKWGNRSAKLKQSKLDVRREQWLSQVKDGKEVKAVASPAAAGANSGSPILASPHPPLPCRRAETRTRGGEPEEDKEAGGARQEQKHCSGNGGNHSLSSGISAWSSSRSVSDAEDEETGGGAGEEEDGVLDDWEAVADALSVGNGHN